MCACACVCLCTLAVITHIRQYFWNTELSKARGGACQKLTVCFSCLADDGWQPEVHWHGDGSSWPASHGHSEWSEWPSPTHGHQHSLPKPRANPATSLFSGHGHCRKPPQQPRGTISGAAAADTGTAAHLQPPKLCPTGQAEG